MWCAERPPYLFEGWQECTLRPIDSGCYPHTTALEVERNASLGGLGRASGD